MNLKDTTEKFPIGCKVAQAGFVGVVINIIEYDSTKQCHVEVDWVPVTKQVMARMRGEYFEVGWHPDSLQHPNNISKVE